MTQTLADSAYGELIDPTAVRITRMLPGPIDRVWRYLTDSGLRGQWLATGDMTLERGSSVELVWRNGELGDVHEPPPEGMSAENRMVCEVMRAEPPHMLVIGWGASDGEVTFELRPQGSQVMLTLTHRRLPDRAKLLSVSAGWHAHLDILVARLDGTSPPGFWSNWTALMAAYDKRLPA